MKTLEDLKQELQDIDIEYERNKNRLIKEYSESTQRYSIGDILSNNNTTLIVNKVENCRGWLFLNPHIIYSGVELTKKMKPRKSGAIGCISDDNNPNNPVELIKKGG